jgi:predicted RND superfamily exporter protein
MERIAHFVIRYRTQLLIFFSLFIVFSSSFISRNELNDDFVRYFDQRVPFRQATDYMQTHLSGMTTIELSIDSKKENGVNDPTFLRTVLTMVDWLRQQAETDHVSSITDTLKQLNQNMHADDPKWYRLPNEKALTAQYLLLYELSLPQGLDINHQLDVKKSSTRLIVTFQNLSSNKTIEMESRIRRYFLKQETPYQLTLASPSLMFAHIGQSNIVNMLLGSFFAFILISFLLGIALRSISLGLISLLPNLIPASIAFGCWGLFVGEVGLGLSVVMGVTLGIVVDDTIHFMTKYRRARYEKGLSPEDAIHFCFASVGRALWITTAVLISGFGVMATSSFKINAQMGLLTAITILIALLIDFLFLPPLLLFLSRKQSKNK